jgi:hypothetical protein
MTTRLAERGLPASVRNVLRWDAPTDLHNRVWRHHAELLAARWSATLSAFVSAGVGLRLASLADDLDAEGLERLLTAPETCRRLLHERPTDLVFFQDSVRAELCRADLGRIHREPVWTALGDAYVPGRSGVRPPRSTIPAGWWDPRERFDAPLLPGAIPVDCVSPFAVRAVGLIAFPYVAMDGDEFHAAVRRLTSAMISIAEVSGATDEMVRASTRVVVVRKDPGAPRMFSSFSSDQFVGRVALVNVHGMACHHALAADALIHEAIHSLLYGVEQQQPLVEDRQAAEVDTVASPWSGRALPVHSFFHACLVWFGLSHFWRRAREHSAFERDQIKDMLRRSRRGFCEPGFGDALADARHHLRSGWDFIADLGAEVREMQV